MAKPDPKPDDLYERDFYAWTQEQASKLRARAHNTVDWENVAEEIEGVGASEKREIRNRLKVLILHLLKWRYQPERRKEGWRLTIDEQRDSIAAVIEDSPSLQSFPADVAARSYRDAVRKAHDETGLPVDAFPAENPFTIAEVLDAGFLPNGD
jgi:hypothetical protein